MKNIYVVTWPNGTISILTANNKSELIYRLDHEGDATDVDVKIERVKTDKNGDFYLTTEITENQSIKVATTGEDDSEKLILVKLKK
jgi:flagellar basal body rod protein FlgF